jgi:hypothetical protein
MPGEPDFLGERYHPDMAAPAAEASRHHHTKGIHRGVLAAVNTASTGRWRSGLTPSQQRVAQSVAGHLLTELGYPLDDLGPMEPSERARARAMAGKFAALGAGRRVLRAAGVHHPTDLLGWLPRQRSGRP